MPITVPLDADDDYCRACHGQPVLCVVCCQSRMNSEEQLRQTHRELPRSDKPE